MNHENLTLPQLAVLIVASPDGNETYFSDEEAMTILERHLGTIGQFAMRTYCNVLER